MPVTIGGHEIYGAEDFDQADHPSAGIGVVIGPGHPGGGEVLSAASELGATGGEVRDGQQDVTIHVRRSLRA